MNTNPMPTKSTGWSVRLYRQLMRIYPQEFTTNFGVSVDQAFRDLARDAFRDRGYLGLLLLWFRVVPDFIFSTYELFTAKAGNYLKWSFRLRWLVACSVGFAAGLTLSNLLGWTQVPPYMRGITLWLIIGFLQSRVLTSSHCNRVRWILLSAVGPAVAAGLTSAVFDPIAAAHVLPSWALPLLNAPAAIHGAIIGIFQWEAFRKGQLNKSRWVLTCAVGLYAFWFVMIAGFSPMMRLFQYTGDVIGMDINLNTVTVGAFMIYLTGGAIFGAITGVPLERMLRIQQLSTEAEARTDRATAGAGRQE